MTPNTLSSLLAASNYIPDEERQRAKEQKQMIKQEICMREKREREEKEKIASSKCSLSAESNEFIPGLTSNFIKRQLSVINEDDEEDLFQDDNFDYFETQQS